MTHSDANTRPHMLNEINERLQSIAGCEDMFDIIPKRYLFDHTSLVPVGGLCCQRCIRCTHHVIQLAAKIKRRQSKNERRGEGGG